MIPPEMNRGSRSIALVSGKGGSGKTIIAAVMGKVCWAHDAPSTPTTPLLVDADIGTAGLSFYLGLELVTNTSKGLSNILMQQNKSDLNSVFDEYIQPLKLPYSKAYFLSAGDHRRYPRILGEQDLSRTLENLVPALKKLAPFVIIDCRGGIDAESLAVCKAVDDIILIVETDTTSYQACQYLVDILSQSDLSHKLKGFIINKVFEDPRVVIRNGTALFRSQYLGSIPFDFQAMRDFFSGKIPSVGSIFGRHVEYAMAKAYPELFGEPQGSSVFNFRDYAEIGLSTSESAKGGIAVALLLLLLTGAFILNSKLSVLAIPVKLELSLLGVLGLLGSLENTRKTIGSVLNLYLRLINRLFSGS